MARPSPLIMAVGVYRFTNQDDELRVLFVPRFSGSERLPTTQTNYTIESATLALGEQFDHTATFFCRSSTDYTRMVDGGFTNVILLSDIDGEIWTCENDALIITFDSRGYTITKSNVPDFSLRMGESTPITFPSDTRNPEWIEGIVGYYGGIGGVWSDGTFFLIRYPKNLLREEGFTKLWSNTQPFNPPNDPYAQGGTTGDDESEPTGGDGEFDNEEAWIDPPALPSLSALASGLITLYNPTNAQLQALGDFMWSDLFDLDTFKKLFSDPMSAILGLSIVPVQPELFGDATVVLGNVNTGVTMPMISSQYVTVDCGSVTVQEYWGGYLDYAPYTKVEIALPYVGIKTLDTDDVMNRTLHVVYHIDIMSGGMVVYISSNDTIRYMFTGQGGASIPITGNDWTNVVHSALSVATSIGLGVATGGIGAGAGGAISATALAGAGAVVGGVANQVIGSKPKIERSGSLAGNGGLLGIQTPFLLITRPRQAVPSGQNSFTGYPAFITRTLSSVSGFTQVTGVHLINMTCTEEEKTEIETLLREGVIL